MKEHIKTSKCTKCPGVDRESQAHCPAGWAAALMTVPPPHVTPLEILKDEVRLRARARRNAHRLSRRTGAS